MNKDTELAAQAAELATLRERLAAAEELFRKCGGVNVIWEHPEEWGTAVMMSRVNIGGFCLWRAKKGSASEYLRHDGDEETNWIWKSPIDMHQAAFAAAWIPPSTKGEG